MRLKYVGPKATKLVNRFWGKEYLFDPFCEVTEIDALSLLTGSPGLFVKADPRNPGDSEGPGDPVNLVESIESVKTGEPSETNRGTPPKFMDHFGGKRGRPRKNGI